MSIDAYHRWLGIPPAEQPPNLYRLLGINAFESDPDVIDAAADRQMTHLRQYQSGQYAALSQKLLNEVAAARVCLLSEQKRAAYDARLRGELERQDQTAAAEAVASAVPFTADSPTVSTAIRRRHRQKRVSWVMMGLAALGLLILAGIVFTQPALLATLGLGGNDHPAAKGEPDGDRPHAGAGATADRPPAQRPVKTT